MRRPDILIVEGLNVLQPPRPQADGRSRMSVSDYFDFSVYVDARDRATSRRWYVERFLRLRAPRSPTRRRTSTGTRRCPTTPPRETALAIWAEVNEPNLVQNIRPTRGRATLVLEKGPDHAVRRVRLRKL